MPKPSHPIIAVAENAFAGLDAIRQDFADAAEFRVGPLGTPDEVAQLTAGASALVVTLQPLREQHLAAVSKSVGVIGRAGVGLDTIDLEKAADNGLKVYYMPDYATNEVADQAASLALASWRRLASADRVVRESGWGTARQVGRVHALQDATLGVLGTGRIGRALIQRMKPFVRRVVVFDAYRDDSLDGVEWAESPSDLFARANLLSLHVPLTAETHHIVGAAAIETMPPGAVVVNVSRGGLVDETALAEALVSGRLAAAGIDVFETEPLPGTSPLRTAPNLLLSPHIAWYSEEAGDRLALWTLSDAVSYARDGIIAKGSWAR